MRIIRGQHVMRSMYGSQIGCTKERNGLYETQRETNEPQKTERERRVVRDKDQGICREVKERPRIVKRVWCSNDVHFR